MKESVFSTSISYIQNNGGEIIGRLFGGLIAFIAIYIIIKYIVKRIKIKIEGESLVTDLYAKRNSNLVGGIMFILLMIFNVLATFEIMGFDVAIIMGGISLSIGFAMETTIGNLISGVFILTNKKIKLGDSVEFLGSLKILGIIEEVNVRYTVVRNFDKRRTIIPNSLVAKTPIRTIKSEPILKGEIGFTIPRETPFEPIKKIFKQIIDNNKNIIYPDYSNIIIENFNKKGINIKGFFFTDPMKKMPIAIAREIKGSLFESLKKININIPYQQITISTEE